MKALTALVFAIAALTSATAFAGPDDEKWIKQCQADNKDEGAKPEVITKYCTCMNDKMDNNETRSITQWEKANPNTQKACSAQAGWK
ncbi:MAG: hypothetical protein HYX47_14400 [Burkholderiales bacterium]|nr:hypothetical protein [Burkholderiales bacterium]